MIPMTRISDFFHSYSHSINRDFVSFSDGDNQFNTVHRRRRKVLEFSLQFPVISEFRPNEMSRYDGNFS